MAAEPVTLEGIIDAAHRIVTRLELGEYRREGPRGNILHVESWAAWNTLVNELTKEGYTLVTSAEYAEINRLSGAEVGDLISRHGTLFALLYLSGPLIHCAVPLPEKEPPPDLGPVPL